MAHEISQSMRDAHFIVHNPADMLIERHSGGVSGTLMLRPNMYTFSVVVVRVHMFLAFLL